MFLAVNAGRERLFKQTGQFMIDLDFLFSFVNSWFEKHGLLFVNK